jgi:hypothetical protein
LWETEGKGDQDIGVALYRVLSEGDAKAGASEYTFEVELPTLPVSYSGTLFKLRWIVRVRRLAPDADDTVVDAVFNVAWPS